MNFFAENLKVFKKVFLPLFALVVLSSNIDQYLNLKMETALRDPLGVQTQVVYYGFLSILSSILFPVLLASIALFALNSLDSTTKTLQDFWDRHLNQMYIETLRAWGKTLQWTLLLIIPGIWKYVELSMVPFVVTSSQQYDEGKVDALKGSAQIVRRRWFVVLSILVLFHLFIPGILTTIFDAYRLIWKTPLQSLLLSALDTYLLLVSTHILFNIFRSEVRRHDAHV
ncbi:hypothetical protein Bb109J_c1603 [Bdellovibrio bacteriovorus]|uniref:Glycerophosphoryl diester phosphodiesterase membrane domain-containing protein n=2 Tax=Bdellovibrio bacteriovorus TaxID=959 RepID=Q6MM63_BDEBA|nr:hypothetical protein [Bdellovibrio bacteriovorus]AHZ84295.1 hypothetical protein EP01_05005 [Bdellovibrio bacteriovorus]BEV68183.1 hypothetical protein Bb109J_c1603 [Bdellovibrio bacteriovorus]CAE79642.1 hypothetical protein predicted by Glimmer/Critica [Bdellovibrio bacteriovorus HD100]